MKKQTLLLILATSLLSLTTASCKKNNSQHPTTQSNQQPITGSNIDTSKVGRYKMISSSISSEMDSFLVIILRFKSYQNTNSLDTNQKTVFYSVYNNFITPQGTLIISKTAIFKDESINKSQPQIKVNRNDISGGFDNSTLVKLNGSNMFKGDTLLLNFYVSPLTGGNYNNHCKYIKL